MKITKIKTFKEVAFWIMIILLYTLSANMMNVHDDLIAFGGFIILVSIVVFGVHRVLWYAKSIFEKDNNKNPNKKN